MRAIKKVDEMTKEEENKKSWKCLYSFILPQLRHSIVFISLLLKNGVLDCRLGAKVSQSFNSTPSNSIQIRSDLWKYAVMDKILVSDNQMKTSKSENKTLPTFPFLFSMPKASWRQVFTEFELRLKKDAWIELARWFRS